MSEEYVLHLRGHPQIGQFLLAEEAVRRPSMEREVFGALINRADVEGRRVTTGRNELPGCRYLADGKLDLLR